MPGDFFQRPGIAVLQDGKLKPEVYDIMDIIKKYDAVLATGHISPEESVFLCRVGRARGVRMILTHPEFSRTSIDSAVQRDLAQLGVYIEKCWYNLAEQECTAAEMAAHIRQVGARHCYMTTDRGQSGREHPVDALRRFAATLLAQGISAEDLDVMMHRIPQEIIA